jgi:Ca2+:H+ antiporter
MINRFNPAWTIGLPVLSFVFIGLYHFISQTSFIILLLCVGLIASVSCAIHHAEVIALKVGEPFGTLVLALSVTIIELALIVSMMISGGPEAMGLARDTIFAAVMIIINAIIGLSLFIGATKHQIQGYNLEGVTAALSVMTVIVVFAMILPNYVTSSVMVGIYSAKQLIFIAFITLVLFIGFTFFQTVRHRDYFLPVETQAAAHLIPEQPTKPDHKTTFISLIMLILSLIAVVMSAKGISPSLEVLLNQAGAPMATLGIIIAAIVLLPEFGAAIRAATSNRLQSSLNLAIGSAIASIGLTIPAVALLSVYMGWQLELGLDAKSTALLVLSLFIVAISLRTGLTTILPGIVHLCIFLTYLFFSFVP